MYKLNLNKSVNYKDGIYNLDFTEKKKHYKYMYFKLFD